MRVFFTQGYLVVLLSFLWSWTTSSQEIKGFEIDTLGYSTDTRLKEISGLVLSKMNANRFWVHNDSGDDPKLYALSTSMQVTHELFIEEADHMDWEDLAAGRYHNESYLFIGDIGDNAARRSTIDVYMTREPVLDSTPEEATLTSTRISLVYPDGPRDAEALLYDERYEELIIITKRDERARVYAIGLAEVRGSTTNTLQFIGELTIEPLAQDLAPMRRYLHYITAADQHENGNVIIKNYFRVWRFENKEGEPLKEILVSRSPEQLPYLLEQQGEAIAFDREGIGYYTTSECADDGTTHVSQPLVYYRKGQD